MGVKVDLNIEADKEEVFWEQRARVNWLRNGDRNTQFFHSCASHRRRVNRIDSLLDDDGEAVYGDDALNALATDYFASLFTTQGSASDTSILDEIPSLRSNKEDYSVLRPYISEARGISKTFSRCQFAFTPRGGNVVAHRLAHFGRSLNMDSFWIEEIHVPLVALVEADRQCWDAT
ncbi:hypothetical protein V6N13_143106 [Hibiscus sabdariffa]